MTTTEPATDLLCASLRLTKEDALHRVHGGVRSLFRHRCAEATLWYKPLWEVRASLTRRASRGGPEQLVAVVDGLTGIARCRRPADPGTARSAEPTNGKRLVPPAVDAARAQEAAERVIRRMARRRRLLVDGFDEPLLFYKPIWLVARTAGERASYAVDASSGVLARVLA